MASYRRSERGSVLTEAATSLPVVLAVVLFGMQFALISFKAISLQYAVNRTMRWAVLGQQLDGSGTPLSRERSIEKHLGTIGNAYGLTFSSVDPNISENPNIRICANKGRCEFYCAGDSCPADNAGGQRSFIIVAARQPISIFGWNLELKASAYGRNEPYVDS